MTLLDTLQIIFISSVALIGIGGLVKVLFFSDAKK